MRLVRYSATFHDQLRTLLDQGLPLFGAALIAKKRDLLRHSIERHLAQFPRTKRPDPQLNLTVYPVSGTPFIVLYDFDDTELRVHFVFHYHSDLRDLDPSSAQW